MLNHQQFIKLEDKDKLTALLNQIESILNKYPYNKNGYTSNMDILKTAISQCIAYNYRLLVDYSDTEEDK